MCVRISTSEPILWACGNIAGQCYVFPKPHQSCYKFGGLNGYGFREVQLSCYNFYDSLKLLRI